MNRTLHSVYSIGLALACASASLADDDNAAEMKRLQGRFERSFTNAAGTAFRTVKEMGDGQETVVTYDDAGNVVESHQSQFKVEKRGPVRVFSFFNLVVTAGLNKGRTQHDTNSFIYRIEGDTMIEAWGLLENDPNPPRIFSWRRVKDGK
jgi:hypothetical protein